MTPEAGQEQAIVGFHQDAARDWVAELACGHQQHVRHDPPWTQRPWVVSEAGRTATLGRLLVCRKCAQGAPRDWPAPAEC
jgi:hypothetical protein